MTLLSGRCRYVQVTWAGSCGAAESHEDSTAAGEHGGGGGGWGGRIQGPGPAAPWDQLIKKAKGYVDTRDLNKTVVISWTEGTECGLAVLKNIQAKCGSPSDEMKLVNEVPKTGNGFARLDNVIKKFRSKVMPCEVKI